MSVSPVFLAKSITFCIHVFPLPITPGGSCRWSNPLRSDPRCRKSSRPGWKISPFGGFMMIFSPPKNDKNGVWRMAIWLAVDLPLWRIWVRQLGWWHSQLNGTIQKCSKPPTSYEYVIIILRWLIMVNLWNHKWIWYIMAMNGNLMINKINVHNSFLIWKSNRRNHGGCRVWIHIFRTI